MPNHDLSKIDVRRKTGDEPFHADGHSLDSTLQAFWQWSGSDLMSNTLRGILAEYLVGCALGLVDDVRMEWDAYDLRTADGKKIEVKSAAYLQSWTQPELSQISFGIAPTFGWDAATNEWDSERKRQADIYVFALFKHQEKATADPLNIAQWEFYVVPTTLLNEHFPAQKRLSLKTLHKFTPHPVKWFALLETIEQL